MLLLSLGSNLSSTYGNRFKNINLAISYLQENNIKLIKKSSFYETPAYPNDKDPKFINVVIEVATRLKAEDLASILLKIENKLGRKRSYKNQPRTCDIDIIDYNGKIVNFKYQDLIFNVPHEKLAYRNFVLIPLYEIIPDWKHPKTKEKITTLREKLTEEDRKSILKIKEN